ncbi:hypothetical protein VOLCADRAFT_119175, partial [Volvox carteri f. nagariensis]
ARLAFSPYLAGATMDAVVPYKDSEPKMPEPLAAARVLLQRAVLQRLRELQLLVEWPLLRPPCTAAQMERLFSGGMHPSELVGLRNGTPLEYPRLLPALQGLCLLGPMDFAVALATGGAPPLQQQHLGKLIGVDDRALPWFRDIKVAAARAVVSEGSIRGAIAFAVFGVPHGERAVVWETALGLRRPTPPQLPPGFPQAHAGSTGSGGGGGGGGSGLGGSERASASSVATAGGGDGGGGATADSGFGAEERERFERLCTKTLEQPLLLDVVVSEDVGPLVGDSGTFFLFEEPIRGTAATLPTAGSSDAGGSGGSAASSSKHPQHPPYYPPSGVLPYRGISLLAAPLCYMYDSAASSYHMFRALYCRYWSKLHSLSSAGPPSPALPGLLRVFEYLLQELDSALVNHLSRLGLLPATLVLPWITTAFAGVLPVQEVLLLWDRVIGLDSLLPLPLLAAAVLCFRRHVLLSCTSPLEVVSALSDVSQLRVVPLLQAVLFPGPGSEA